MSTEYQERLKSTGRNDVCPCGSERKYKKCHLAEDQKAQQAQNAAEAAEAAAVALAAKEAESDDDEAKPKAKAGSGRKADRSRSGTGPGGRQGGRANNMPRRSAI